MLLVKIGGGESINVPRIIEELSLLKEKLIIVHGANAVRDKLADDLGTPKTVLTSVSGYQSVYSDEQAIDIMMMAYSGLRNKRIVELCQQHGMNAVGLSGVDGGTIKGRRNTGIRVKEGGKVKIVRDFSGKPKEINVGLLQLLLDNGYTPVLCVPILDERGFAINSENDDILGLLQNTFHADKVLQFIEAPGYLENKDDADSLVLTMNRDDLLHREEQAEGRMKRKMLALRKLFENGAASVVIADGRTDNPVTDALNGKGTVIQ